MLAVQRVVVTPSIPPASVVPDAAVVPVAVQTERWCVVAVVGCPRTFISSIDHVNAVALVELTRTCRACCVAKLVTTNRDVPVPDATCVKVDPLLETDTV